MDATGAFTYFTNPHAGPESAQLDELSYTELLTGTPLRVNPRLLESLPWRKMNDFLAAVGTERSLEALALRVLQEMEALLPFDYGIFGVARARVMDQPVHFIEFRTPPGLVREYFSHYIRLDPCLPRYASTCRGVARWAFHECEFTRDFLWRYGTRHSMEIGNIKESADAGFNLVLQRTARLGFNDREMALYFILRPHLRNLFGLLYAPQKASKGRLAAVAGACGLTGREGEVVQLLCDRLSASEIADQLKISRRTVEKHIEHVYLKLRVNNRKGLREETILADAFGSALGNRRA